MSYIDKIKGIDQEIKLLESRIKLLKKQRKELELVSVSERKKFVTCNNCGSNEVFIKFKGNEKSKLIGLYCMSCIEQSKNKKTGYIKFLSKKEYLIIKSIRPDISEVHEEKIGISSLNRG